MEGIGDVLCPGMADATDEIVEGHRVELDAIAGIRKVLPVFGERILDIAIVFRRDDDEPSSRGEAVEDHGVCQKVLPPKLLEGVRPECRVIRVFE